jgi:uncharacterized protein (DUF305 family)
MKHIVRNASPALIIVLLATAAPVSTPDAAFVAQAKAAMTAMMNGMAVRPTGDVDKDFVEMMVPHHQGAIAMAKAELRYGRNEQLRRLAHDIIVAQQAEIGVMTRAVNLP